MHVLLVTPRNILSRLKTSGPLQSEEIILGSLPVDLKSVLPLAELQLHDGGSWHAVVKLIVALKKPLFIDEWPEEHHAVWRQIVELCQNRCQLEDSARKKLLSEHTVKLWLSVGHLHSGAVKSRLQHWLTQKGHSDVIQCDSYTSLFGRWRGLVEAVRSAAEVTPPEWEGGHPSAQDWESVLLFMAQLKNSPKPECDIFGKCELCWRFVPLAEATGHNHLYCREHQWNTLEYKRALKLNAEANRFSSTLDASINHLYKQSRETWIAHHQNLPENWEVLFRDDIVALAKAINKPMEYSLDIVARYFPSARLLTEKAGLEFSPLGIVKALDPIPAGLPADIRIRWEALHHVFINNLALFRRELCHAEIFLSLYDRLFSGIKRGGARPRKKA